MKKFIVPLLLMAIAVDGVADNVGASAPEIANLNSNLLTVAIADTGAGSRWAPLPLTSQTLANSTEVKEFEMFAEGLSDRIDQELDSRFSKKLDAMLLAQD